jgi:hypothetical protein
MDSNLIETKKKRKNVHIHHCAPTNWELVSIVGCKVVFFTHKPTDNRQISEFFFKNNYLNFKTTMQWKHSVTHWNSWYVPGKPNGFVSKVRANCERFDGKNKGFFILSIFKIKGNGKKDSI